MFIPPENDLYDLHIHQTAAEADHQLMEHACIPKRGMTSVSRTVFFSR
jgi:hypothetical protein